MPEPCAIIRRKNGAVDDVVITGNLLRMEQMHDGLWWVCIYRGEQKTAFFLSRKGKRIVAEVSDDTIGCTDDTEQE